VALDLRQQERRLGPRRARALQPAQRAQRRLELAALRVGARGHHLRQVAVIVARGARALRQRLAEEFVVPADRELFGADLYGPVRGRRSRCAFRVD
jgi:hypothetical protein